MANVRIEFGKLDGVSPDRMRKGEIRLGYTHADAHMIFDIKMDGNLKIKSMLVSDGYTTAPPSSITHPGVMSR